MKKRLLSALLAIVMIFTMIPNAFAAADFTDVKTGAWYADAVKYVSEEGLMSGTGSGKFSPGVTTDRGMIVSILWRLAGHPAAAGEQFSDVSEGAYYADAVRWAANAGVAAGYNGKFSPNNAITREQLAQFLFMYAQYAGMDVVKLEEKLGQYPDAGQVSAYAVPAMNWAVERKLISGNGVGMLTPKAEASRAEVAVIFMNFCKLLDGGAAKTGEYTVTFAWNYGGKGEYDSETVDAGNTVDEPKEPSRSGYEFEGWYTKESGGKKFDFDTEITEDITLHARWSKNGGSGSSRSDNEDTHLHRYTASYKSVGDGTHKVYCSCDAYKLQACSYGAWESNEDGTHRQVCSECGHAAIENCALSGTENCPVCGYAGNADYYISSAADLIAFAEAVNVGEDFSDKVVALNADIDLTGVEWTPIGTSENAFNGTFDGQKHTISNLTATGIEFVGLFGCGWTQASIENVNLEDVTIIGNHFVGAVIAHTYGDVKNCTVDGLEITVTPNEVGDSYDNGDKVGGIAGWAACGEISDCAVSNGTIAAYRDVGGILGASIADNTNTVVTDCAVSDVMITVDQTQTANYGYKTPNANAVIGRSDGDAEMKDNTVSNVAIEIKLAEVEGEIIVADVNGKPYTDLQEAVAAAKSGDTVTMLADATVAATKGGYNLAGLAPEAGVILDGNGKKLTVSSANDTWDCAIYTTGGTIKNLTIGGAFRGIFTAGCNENIIIDNVVIDNVCYTFSSDEANPIYSVIVTDSTLNGWTSYSGEYQSVSFTDCTFGQGTGGYRYAYIRPYSDTTFTNCEFEEGFALDACQCTNFLNDCTVGGVELTAYNLTELLGAEAADAIVNGQQLITGTYSSTLTVSRDMVLKDLTVTAASGPAIVIDGDVALTIDGDVTLIGATDGIEVPAGSEMTLTGANGTLVVVGGSEDETTAGSGIGNVNEAVGTITIDGLQSLTAQGNGQHAFGIGGNLEAPITIQNTTIEYVKGGLVQKDFVNDTSYGKTEPEGGAAIGIGSGASCNKIVLNNVTITKAEGGSKAAAIGAQYWASANITITDSELLDIVGGNASAAIGGSRVSDDGDITDEEITIKITDSEITAVGGQFAAAIGSGYDTHCQTVQPMCEINISGSTITATGGQYAAGIGTGYHNAQLSGEIEDSEINATAGGFREKYTMAQDIGFGVVDLDREAKDNDCYIVVDGKKIAIPAIEVEAGDSGSLAEAIANNEKVAVTLTASGSYTMPSASNKQITISGTEDTVVTVNKPNLSGSDVVLEGVTVQGNGYATGVQHVNTVTYADAVIKGAMCLYGEKVVFNNCVFDLTVSADYCWTYGAKEVEFNNCEFRTLGKAILIYNEGADVNTKVTVQNCVFLADVGAKAGAIANQNCAAIEIDSTYGDAFTLITSDNEIDSDFSGEWRIKTCGTAVTVNGTEYNTIAIDGKAMTIDAHKNVTVNG